MNRRRYLAGLVGGVAGLAGCLGGSGGDGGSGTPQDLTPAGGNDSATPTNASTTPTPPPSANPPNVRNVDLPVEKSQLNRGAAKNAIPAITEPAFGADWSDTEYDLADDEKVIGVVRDDRARAYPLSILDYHEIVNDDFAGPLLVTYCPLCGSGMTAERTVDGQETVFGVSGYLFRSDLVMYDELTDSLWSQIMATAIHGEKTGQTLTLVPSSMTTWGAWKTDYPDAEVLLPPPKSGTIVERRPAPYDRTAYAGYDDNEQIGVGYNDFDDDRLHPKTQVIGVATEGAAKAYPFEAVTKAGVVNDSVGELPVVVAAGPEETLYAYDRRVDGDTLTFEAAGDRRMKAGGSRWTITSGEAVSGPHEGRRLDQASGATTMFWFAWVDFHPETAVYGGGK